MKVYYYYRSNPFTRLCAYIPNGDISAFRNDPNIIIVKTQVVH